MKIIKTLLFFLILSIIFRPAISFAQNPEQSIQGGIEFDWIKIEQHKRNELIESYRNAVMNHGPDLAFSKDAINSRLKDSDAYNNCAKVKAGIEQDESRIMVGFYKGKLLYAYGIIEKSNPRNAYYYDTLGKLRYVDFLEKDYNEYPYVSIQYATSGRVVARVYNLDKYDQFMYSEEGKFLGRWYQNKLYNRNGHVTMARGWF